jgi:hypothetical protein
VVPFSLLRKSPVVAGRAGRTAFVVFYRRGVASALDAEQIGDSRDVGTAAALEPCSEIVLSRSLRGPVSGQFTDGQTGSRWDMTGAALSGPLQGRHLVPVRHDEQYWFALAAFVSDATLVR